MRSKRPYMEQITVANSRSYQHVDLYQSCHTLSRTAHRPAGSTTTLRRSPQPVDASNDSRQLSAEAIFLHEC